jgi:hypothetical protein
MKVGLVVGVVLFVTIAGAQQSTTSTTPRRSYFQQHSSLLSQLQAEDKDVEVTRLGSIPFVFLQGNTTEIESATKASELVAVVRISSKVSALTPGGDWLTSTVSGTVLTILKDVSGEIRPGGKIVFAEDGGEMQVGAQTVRAVNSWVAPTNAGRDYLVFLSATPEGLRLSPASYEVVGSQSVTLLRESAEGRRVQGPRSLVETVNEIRASAK